MASTRKTRDYKSAYQRRKELAQSRGFSSPYAETKQRAQRGVLVGPATAERAALSKWGVSRRQFEAMRIANLEYGYPSERLTKKRSRNQSVKRRLNEAIILNSYDASRDVEGDWSDDRIGYVITFNKAIVDPRTNYASLFDENGLRKMRGGRPLSNRWQKAFMTQYADKATGKGRRRKYMEVDEFESRYGTYGTL